MQRCIKCGVDLDPVTVILKRCRETGFLSLNRKENVVKRKTTHSEDHNRVRKSKMHPKLTAVHLNTDLATSGISVSDMTISRRLLEAARAVRTSKKKQLLTKK